MNQCMREKKLAREKKREERELKRIQEAIQKKTGTLSTEQQKKPIVPISTQKSGGWTNGSAITSGWTNETTISYNGGWISSTEQQKKPIAPISAPKSSTGGGGGWINEPSGWTNQTTISNSGGSASDTSKNTTVPNNNTSTAPSETKPIFASEPKKLSFGLKKKTTSFQFGLKKNH